MNTRAEDNTLWVVRAIAILFVLFGHFMLLLSRELTGQELHLYFLGRFGVYLFFCLSGYLLGSRYASTSIHSNNWVREFYIRRFERIIPPLLAMVFVYALLAKFLIGRSFTTNEILTAISFFTNYTGNHPLLQHLWSLAVECHTYLVLPLIIACIRVSKKNSILLLDSLIVLGWLFNIYLSTTNLNFSGEETHACIWAILAGVRLGVRPLTFKLVGLISVVSLGAGALFLKAGLPATKTVLFGVLYTCVGLALIQWRHIFRGNYRWLVLIGKRAYSIYLFQQMVFYSELNWLPRLMLALVAVALIEISYRYVEPLGKKFFNKRTSNSL